MHACWLKVLKCCSFLLIHTVMFKRHLSLLTKSLIYLRTASPITFFQTLANNISDLQSTITSRSAHAPNLNLSFLHESQLHSTNESQQPAITVSWFGTPLNVLKNTSGQFPEPSSDTASWDCASKSSPPPSSTFHKAAGAWNRGHEPWADLARGSVTWEYQQCIQEQAQNRFQVKRHCEPILAVYLHNTRNKKMY